MLSSSLFFDVEPSVEEITCIVIMKDRARENYPNLPYLSSQYMTAVCS